MHTLNEKFHERFDDINKLIKLLRKKKILDKNLASVYKDGFSDLRSNYNLYVVRIIGEYSQADKHTQLRLDDEFRNYVSRINLDQQIDDLFFWIKKDIFTSGKEFEKVNHLVNQCDEPVVKLESKRLNYDRCECGGYMEMYPNASELRCSICAEIEDIKGTEFEEHSISDPNKQKKGDYDPSRFVDVWIDRIQAIREVKFKNERVLGVIRESAKKDGLRNKHEITCEYIRLVWKIYGRDMTNYNDDAAYARYRITGILPPQLSHRDRRFIRTVVIRIMRIFNQIKDPTRSNSLYYAYVLYKVIKQFFAGKPEIRLLESIHIQKEETLTYNDSQYKKICDKYNEQYNPKLRYEPTVVNESIY